MRRSNCFVKTNIAEGILEGIFDFLLPQERIKWESVSYRARTRERASSQCTRRSLAKFGQLQDTAFILDGDQRGGEVEGREYERASGHGANISILFLPGSGAPESWVLEKLHQHLGVHASRLEIDPGDLSNLLNRFGRYLCFCI